MPLVAAEANIAKDTHTVVDWWRASSSLGQEPGDILSGPLHHLCHALWIRLVTMLCKLLG